MPLWLMATHDMHEHPGPLQTIDGPDTAIVITSLKPELFKICRSFIPADTKIWIIDGTTGRYGMRAIAHMIECAPCEVAILLDEDAFILDYQRLLELVAWVSTSGTVCVGMADGGILPIRQHNPNAFNSFFNIIDLRKVRAKWNAGECRAHRGRGQTMSEVWCPKEILSPDVQYVFNDFETYYCFYFWLHAKGLRMEWLTGRTHTDGISTILNDRNGDPILLHTWYGRRFGIDPAQTARIVDAALWASDRIGLHTASARRHQAVRGV